MNDAEGVRKLLRDRHHVNSARYHGDTDASCILLDLHSAILSAGLSERQAEALAWISGADMTQKDAASIMGITQQAAAKLYGEAADKIAAVYKRWEYGEITVSYDLDEETTDDNETEAA